MKLMNCKGLYDTSDNQQYHGRTTVFCSVYIFLFFICKNRDKANFLTMARPWFNGLTMVKQWLNPGSTDYD